MKYKQRLAASTKVLLTCVSVLNVLTDCEAVTKFCMEPKQVIRYTIGTTINITTPNYPNNHDLELDCGINIITNSTQSLVFEMEIVKSDWNNCYPTFEITDTNDEPIVGELQCSRNTSSLRIYGILRINQWQPGVKLILSPVERSGFLLHFTALPLYSLKPAATKVSAVSSPRGYLASHSQFDWSSSYGKNLNSSLTMADVGDQVEEIKLEFLHMSLGPYDSCTSNPDIIRISENISGNLVSVYHCGEVYRSNQYEYETISLPISTSASSLLYQFTTDSDDSFETATGFLIRYSVILNESVSPTSTTEITETKSVSSTFAVDSSTTTARNEVTTSRPEPMATSSSSQATSAQSSTVTLAVIIIPITVLIIVGISIGLTVCCIIRSRRNSASKRLFRQEKANEVPIYEEIGAVLEGSQQDGSRMESFPNSAVHMLNHVTDRDLYYSYPRFGAQDDPNQRVTQNSNQSHGVYVLEAYVEDNLPSESMSASDTGMYTLNAD